jgi:hypothetical protein
VKKLISVLFIVFIFIISFKDAFVYPPAVGILGKSKSCLGCHLNNGPWIDEEKTTIEILDKETGKSLRQSDGSFLIEVKRGTQRTLMTVIGRPKNDIAPAPYRNAWLYIDPAQIESTSLSKFAPGWDVNIPMSCRLVGDKFSGYESLNITALPMTIQPLDNARDTDIQLQVMLTGGESVKDDPKKGMEGNYFVRNVKLAVVE